MPLFRMSMAIVFLFLLGFAINSKADPNYLNHVCSNTTTFTPNSTYQSNLNLLLSSLASNSTNNNGFYKDTAGQNPDTVYGLFLCRGDLSTDVCQNCVTFATQVIVQRCPVEKEVLIGYDECLLRYSDRSFFNNIKEGSMVTMYKTQNGTNRTSYPDLVLATVNDTAIQAASIAKKFATRSSSNDLHTLAQCTQDLSEDNCNRCLQLAIANLQTYSLGARTLTPSCIIRYEAYLFYSQSEDTGLQLPPPSPPPSPPSLPPTASRKGNFSSRYLKFLSLFSTIKHQFFKVINFV